MSIFKRKLKNGYSWRAVVAAAGSLATEYEITGWTEEDAFWAAEVCLTAWIKSRGGTTPQEEKNAFEQVRHFFELHGDSRFSDWDDDSPKTVNRAGYRRVINGTMYYYVLPEVFKKDICRGMHPEFVSKLLMEKGWLMPDSEGKSTRSKNLPDFKRSVRCYRFNAEKIFGG